jgi:hypothetical protein
MRFRQFSPVLGALAVGILVASSVCVAQEEEEDAYEAPERSVTLDAQARQHLGIIAAAAKEVPYRAEITGLGLVVSLDAIAQTEADLETAEAALVASRAGLERARGLLGADNSISKQSFEAAEKQAAADAAQLALAERKSIAMWGRNAPWRNSQQRASVLAALSTGKSVLIRATFPDGSLAGDTPAAICVERLDDSAGSRKLCPATTVWRAPADPSVPGRSYYILVPGAPDLAPGERVRVLAQTGSAEKGAMVPASAVVIAEGRSWLYIEEKANYFVRQAADLSKPLAEGYVMPRDVQAGEPIVIQGAGQLLAREIGTED